MSYRVELPVFSGPLDLLLHLVKQQEVDIHTVRIANILDQYLEHMKLLEALDLSDLGDFLVMASTLMEIKSREMLPREEVELEEDLNPRDDLIRRLLEYKRYRDVSRRLDRLSKRRARMSEVSLPLPKEVRDAHRQTEEEEDLLDLGEIEIWTLTAAFARLLEETGHRKAELQIGIDKRNVHYYAERILDKVRHGSEMDFKSLFDTSEGRYGMIGTFIAVLEMMKQGVLRGHQEGRGEIVVIYRGDPELSAAQILSGGHRLDQDLAEGDAAEAVIEGTLTAAEIPTAEIVAEVVEQATEQASAEGIDGAGEEVAADADPLEAPDELDADS